MSIHDFYFEVGRGRYPQFKKEHKFGRNGVVATADETIWGEGGIYSYPSVATTMTISSDDGSDSASGSGAQILKVIGLDGSYDEVTASATLNGQTGVSLSVDFLRIHRMQVKQVGSADNNIGILYVGSGSVTAGKPANVYGLIEATRNQTLMGLMTVPAGYDAYLTDIYFSVGSGREMDASLCAAKQSEPMQIKFNVNLFQADMEKHFRYPLHFPEKTDIELRGKVDASTIACSGGFELILQAHGTSNQWN